MKSIMFSSLLCSAILASIFSLSAEDRQETQIFLSEVELQEIFSHPKSSYIYVGKEISDIAQVIEEISKLDENPDSLIVALSNHIARGFSVGNYDAVAQALEQAEFVLNTQGHKLDQDKAEALARSLNNIIEQVIEDRLSLDAELLSFLKDKVDVTEMDSTRRGLRLLVVNERMHVHGKSKFYKDVTFTHDVKFKDNVRVEGTLSVADQVASCDLTIGCNLNLNDSTSATVGNITKNGVIFVSNFGINNTCVGANTGDATATGTNNSAFGANALGGNASGSNSTAVGANALASASGNNNIGIGQNAGASLIGGSNNIYIGINTPFSTENNVTRIGGIRGATTLVADSMPVLIDSLGQLGTLNSSEKVKHNIQDMGDESSNIYQMRAVTFAYNSDPKETKQYGFVAEQVAQVLPGIVIRDKDGNPETVQTHVLPALTVNELQKLAARVAVLEAAVQALQARS